MKKVSMPKRTGIWYILTIGLAFALTGSVLAGEVKIQGEKCPLHVTFAAAPAAAEGASAEELMELDAFTVLADIDGARVAILVDGRLGYVDAKELYEALPTLRLDDAAKVSGWTDLPQGSSGDRARQVQEWLVNLKFLNGAADGIYGAMTAQAVSAFQKDAGLPETGTVDLVTWLRIFERVSTKGEPQTLTYPTVVTAEERFPEIYASLEDPSSLDDYLSPAWKYSFDPYTGVGKLDRGQEYGTFRDDSKQIDQIEIVLKEIVYIWKGGSGKLQTAPAIELSAKGAYSPCIQSIFIGAGDKAEECFVLTTDRGVDGTVVWETDILPLGDGARELLSSRKGGLTIKINGKNKVYELTA